MVSGVCLCKSQRGVGKRWCQFREPVFAGEESKRRNQRMVQAPRAIPGFALQDRLGNKNLFCKRAEWELEARQRYIQLPWPFRSVERDEMRDVRSWLSAQAARTRARSGFWPPHTLALAYFMVLSPLIAPWIVDYPWLHPPWLFALAVSTVVSCATALYDCFYIPRSAWRMFDVRLQSVGNTSAHACLECVWECVGETIPLHQDPSRETCIPLTHSLLWPRDCMWLGWKLILTPPRMLSSTLLASSLSVAA